MTSIIRIKTHINPTEDPEKVKKAIQNIFGDIDIRQNQDTLIAEMDETQLTEFRNRINQDRIRTTLNVVLTRWVDGDYLSFGLNRQAAYAGHVSLNLTQEDPMGPIQVQIRGNVTEVINYLCN